MSNEILYTNIIQTLNSLHGLLNCEIGGLDCHVITIEYKTRVTVNTSNTYFVMHWSMYIIRDYLVRVLIQYLKTE